MKVPNYVNFVGKIGVVALFFFGVNQVTHASPLNEQIHEALQKYADQGLLSGTVAIKNSKGILFQRSFGLAVREHQIPNKVETVFGIGSLSKQFTAAGVVYLQQTGKLQVDQNIGKYLEVPPSWKNLTVRQLLTHSSGLPANPEFAPSDWAKFRSIAELFDVLKLQFPVIAPERVNQYVYSNAGYSVLAKLISSVTKEDYPKFMSEFFQLAQLKDTAIDHESMITMNQATGYNLINGRWSKACCLDLSNFAGSGNVRSTVSDLLQWADILYGNTIFTQESKDLLFEGKVPMPQPNQFYGFGWVTEPFLEKNMVWHNGSLRGFMSMMAMYDQETTFVLVGNQNNIPLSKIRDEVMTLVIEAENDSQ